MGKRKLFSLFKYKNLIFNKEHVKHLHLTRCSKCDCTSKDSKPEPKPPLLKTFSIYRWNPEQSKKKPHMQDYTIDINNCGRMVLDALIKIKAEEDPTLSFRRSCREGICGTCGINISGLNHLACQTPIDRRPKLKTRILPLPHMYVIRDLIPDMNHFYAQYKQVDPWLKRDCEANVGQDSYLQSPRDQKKLVGLYECILCNCCSSSCPPYWWHRNEFLGPAALLQMYRWVIDSRDHAHKERLAKLKSNHHSIFDCHTIMNCANACPKNLNPGKAIARLKGMASGLVKKEAPDMKDF